jgi:glycosyltransferase involved in cell wall biosynthesis
MRHARIFEKECRSLAAAGHEVVLVAPHDRDEVMEGVRVRSLRKAKNRAIRMFGTSWRATYLACSERPDVYHLHDPELLLPFQIVRFARGRVCFDMHENLPKAILAKDWIPAAFRRPLSRLMRALQRVLLVRIPVIFAETSYRADYPWLKDWEIILNYTRFDALKPHPGPLDPSRIAYFGSITPQRGISVILEALHLLRTGGRRITLELVGGAEPSYADRVRSFARRHDLDVHLRGYLPMDQACPILNRCGLGLALLQPWPNYVDSYPTKIFDYMAMGMPVLTSDFPLYRSVIDGSRCGLCVDPTRPDLIAAAIRQILDRPEEMRNMAQRGLEAVRRDYNWDTQAVKLLEFYDRFLLEPRHGTAHGTGPALHKTPERT